MSNHLLILRFIFLSMVLTACQTPIAPNRATPLPTIVPPAIAIPPTKAAPPAIPLPPAVVPSAQPEQTQAPQMEGTQKRPPLELDVPLEGEFPDSPDAGIKSPPPGTEEPLPPTGQPNSQIVPAIRPKLPTLPKIGLILGAGGAKSYAHIGFLHELHRLKIPIHSIVGLELSAPIAALYAHKEMANEVEWQMFKLRDDDLHKKGLLNSNKKNIDYDALRDFLRLSFGQLKTEDLKLPFACPAFNLSNQNIYAMNRGILSSLLELCIPYPPLFKPYKRNVSALRDLKSSIEFLKASGANFIILVNVLESNQGSGFFANNEEIENIVWQEISGYYSHPIAGIDFTIKLDTKDFKMTDFNKQREIMLKGSESASKDLIQLSKKIGL